MTATAVAAAAGRPIVTLPQGTVIGISEPGPYPAVVEAFKGIPYALPPVGDRRFRPPAKLELPPSPEKVTIDASRFGPRAPARQFLVVGPELPEDEDCLTVNVFRQQQQQQQEEGDEEGKKKGLLPVALYLHGGAFNRGNAAMHNTGSMVGWSGRPFVGVSCGYRIGALGFLPSKMSADEGALNLGLKDQICAMEWVRDNIGFFGGDKDNVTLIGLSAGAHSIGHHMLNYEPGKPALFHRGVMESGSPTSRAVRYPDSDVHEAQFRDFLAEVKCPTSSSSKDVFAYLRGLPLADIARAQTTVFAKYNPSLCWAFQPVIDGDTIPAPPLDLWRGGARHAIPVMVGFTTNEGSLYVDRKMATRDQFEGFWRELLPRLDDAEIAEIDRLYPEAAYGRAPPGDGGNDEADEEDWREKIRQGVVGPMYRRVEAAYAHYAYVSPVRQTARFVAENIGRKGAAGAEAQAPPPPPPAYVYHWALRGPDVATGARHGDQMWYEMRDEATRARHGALDGLSAAFHGYVTEFVCTGSPNGHSGGGQLHDDSSRPRWESYDPQRPKVMRFGGGMDIARGRLETGGVSGAELVDDTWGAKESEFWMGLVGKTQQ